MNKIILKIDAAVDRPDGVKEFFDALNKFLPQREDRFHTLQSNFPKEGFTAKIYASRDRDSSTTRLFPVTVINRESAIDIYTQVLKSWYPTMSDER